MLKEIMILITTIGLGAGVPVIALLKAFQNIEKMSPWGWVGVSLISIAAISGGIVIFVIGRTIHYR